MGKARTREVGRRLRLVPFWEAYVNRNDDRLGVVIDPGPSFGAGDHPSTIMALELLEDVMSRHDKAPMPSFLDVGTGTGVLAVAALLLGAHVAVAFDVDPVAVVTARRNFELNRNAIQGKHRDAAWRLFVGTVDAVKGGFGLVSANLAAPLLLRICGPLARVSSRTLILSGIADAMIDPVRAAYGQLFVIEASKSVEGWHALRLEKRR
jgi:ribosomal protein L11 methyltransferase